MTGAAEGNASLLLTLMTLEIVAGCASLVLGILVVILLLLLLVLLLCR